MKASALAKRVLARYSGSASHVKTAGFQPFAEKDASDMGGGGQKRDIPKDHPFDPRALKPMAGALWATSVSLGHGLTAYRHLSRLKSTTVSPDGMLGGRGYIMAVKDARHKLFEACEALSSIADTLHDEIEAPHWKSRLAMLDPSDAKEVERFVEKSEAILDDPDNDSMDEEEDDGPQKGDPKGEGSPEEESASEVPSAGGSDADQVAPVRPKMANSTLNVDTIPGGPRVDHLGPAEGQGPYGSYNPSEDATGDAWSQNEGRHELGKDNTFIEASEWAQSTLSSAGLPQDSTPTEAWDFGLGYGAKGQGAGGYENPSDEGNGKGVWGPHSGMPGTQGGPSGDGSSPVLDLGLNYRKALLQSLLPNDQTDPVARSDYYPGAKNNLVQGPLATAELPSEDSPIGVNAPSAMNTFYVQEDLGTPYIRYDYTTHTLREEG